MKLRQSELTAHLNRDLFDAVPGGVTSAVDVERWHRYRAAYHGAHLLTGAHQFPLQLDFELNSTCQLACKFCVHGQQRVVKREMPFETFRKVIDEASEHGLCSIKLNYINEPLLKRDLVKFIEYARSRGVLNVYFATNGLLLSEKKCRELIEAKVSKIMVSIDAASAETYQVMRKSTEYEKVVNNIRRLLELRAEMGTTWPLVRVNFLRTKENEHEAEQFISMWEGVADLIGFQRQVALPGLEDDLLTERTGAFRCSFPWKLLVVDVDGQILPCCTFSGRSLAIGNVKDITIEQAWNSLTHRHLKKLHADGEGMTNSICAHCINGCS